MGLYNLDKQILKQSVILSFILRTWLDTEGQNLKGWSHKRPNLKAEKLKRSKNKAEIHKNSKGLTFK